MFVTGLGPVTNFVVHLSLAAPIAPITESGRLLPAAHVNPLCPP